jgi:hypothetical protein
MEQLHTLVRQGTATSLRLDLFFTYCRETHMAFYPMNDAILTRRSLVPTGAVGA